MEENYLECPNCSKEKLRQSGNVWLEEKHLKISYRAECLDCGYVLDYDDIVYEY